MSATILIVEDNPDNMKLVVWALEDEGYACEGAASAEEAFVRLRHRSYDLILMDISLPGMDGKQATGRIRSDPALAGLPVIAVTAHAIKGEAEAILASGVDALVTKPIDEACLLNTISVCLNKSKRRHRGACSGNR
jgi:two-component system cell cycle response regulator DivK